MAELGSSFAGTGLAALILSGRAYADGVAGVVHLWWHEGLDRMKRRTPGAKVSSSSLSLGLPRGKDNDKSKDNNNCRGDDNTAKATAKQQPSKSNGKSNNCSYGKGGLVWRTFG
jgi:hypothetical protein